MRRALIAGITGQDGSYLAELLLQKGYSVYGLVRRTTADNPFSRIAHIRDYLRLVDADLTDFGSLRLAMQDSRPDEVYNLAAQSFVGTSFVEPVATASITGLGALNLLEAARTTVPEARFYQASTSEMFGTAPAPQDETTPFHPRSPYGVAKVFAHWSAVNYRESHGMFIATGILFNHESPRRGREFVTRKISQTVARIARGEERELVLGNLDARRDWGWAPDYVDAMWRMLQLSVPDDFAIGTGEAHSVAEFCQLAFSQVGLDWRQFVRTDPGFTRPADVYDLRANTGKAARVLGWTPAHSFDYVVQEMVRADLRLLPDRDLR